VKHLNKLDSLLSNRESEFGKQLKINYDLIEVLEGWCFSISRREFVENAISHSDINYWKRITASLIVAYRGDKSPEVAFFKVILENSPSEDEIWHFCEYFIRLLN